MNRNTKRMLSWIVLTAVPIVAVQASRQTSWGEIASTPTVRIMGDPSAKVTIFEFSDFQCPACAHIQPVVQKMLDTYKGKIRIAFKYFPLPMHKNSFPAAHAAQCAADQNQFWPYGEELFQKQREWGELTDPTTNFMAIAQDTRLDAAKFTQCLADPTRDDIIRADQHEGQERQVSATPTFFIGDQRLVGGYFEADGARAIEKELRK